MFLKTNFNLDTSIHRKKGVENTIYERIYIKKDSLETIKPESLTSSVDLLIVSKSELSLNIPGLLKNWIVLYTVKQQNAITTTCVTISIVSVEKQFINILLNINSV